MIANQYAFRTIVAVVRKYHSIVQHCHFAKVWRNTHTHWDSTNYLANLTVTFIQKVPTYQSCHHEFTICFVDTFNSTSVASQGTVSRNCTLGYISQSIFSHIKVLCGYSKIYLCTANTTAIKWTNLKHHFHPLWCKIWFYDSV